MPPLADAVGLVHHEEADVSLELLADSRRPEPLGRDVEHARLARQGAPERLGVLGAGALRVDQLRTITQAVDLVLHERHEGRDDERERFGVLERRQLVAERLSRAGRHDHEDVATAHRCLDGLALPGPEAGVAEVAMERLLGTGVQRGHDLIMADGPATRPGGVSRSPGCVRSPPARTCRPPPSGRRAGTRP